MTSIIVGLKRIIVNPKLNYFIPTLGGGPGVLSN